jgi:hypothetical protein
MNKIRLITFIKAIDIKYFDQFLKEGEICLNTLKWFREYESKDSNIGDKFEGSFLACGKDFKVSMADDGTENWKEVGIGENLTGSLNENDANLFCLFTIFQDNILPYSGELNIPQKFVEEFSHHRFVIFTEKNKFVKKMNQAIVNIGKSMKKGVVEYYKLDDKLKLNLTNFNKPDRFSYQQEYRILYEDPNAKMQILNLGSLEDICMEIDPNQKYKIEICKDNQFLITSLN